MLEWLVHPIDALRDYLRAMSPAQATGATLLSIGILAAEVWAIVRVLSRGHGVQGTLTWIFAILAFPALGVAAFFALASPRVKRVKLGMRRAAARYRRTIDAAASAGEGAEEASESLLDLAATLTALPPTGGNAVRLLTEDVATFARIEEVLRGATSFIWAEYYIIRSDETGRRFLALLTERARAGVSVRLIFDALGSMALKKELLDGLMAAGGLVRAFQPMNPLRRRFSVHLRNHRKLIVVDGATGFTGGMNVGDEYSGRRRRQGLTSFRDSHLELRGPAVQSLAQTFVDDWSFSGGEALAPPPLPAEAESPGSTVAIVPSGPDQEHNASAMVHFAGIAAARRRVVLTSPYFIPDEPTLSALVSSALRRVDVKVMVPAAATSDVKLAALAARSYFGKLLRGGVRIFEYEAAMLHAKTLVVDGRVAFVGSANVDIRSFRLNFEVGALIADPGFAQAMERRFARSLAHAREVTLEELERAGRWMRVKCVFARLLSPLL